MQQAFRTVEQAIVAFERNAGSASERGSRIRVTATQREGAEKEKAYAKVAKEAERWEKERVRSAEQAAKQGATIAERAGREEVRAVEKAERDKQAAADKTARYLAGVHERSAAMAGRYAMAEADKKIAEEKRAHDARVSYAKSMGGRIAGSVDGAVKNIVGAGRGLVAGALQVGGGFTVADSVKREMNLTGEAATLASSSQADADGRKWKTKEILASARSTANAYGMAPEEVLKGIGKYKDLTGNLGDAVKFAPQMAKLATALGADTSELMANAGNAANAGLKGDDILRLAKVQTMQGMQGAVELKDMAKYGARLTAGAGLYGGDRSTNIATMGAFAQIARQHGGASTAAEATLAAQRFTTDVQKNSGKLQKLGINVSDGKGGLRDGREIIKDMLVKSGGDVTKFGQFGLGERGVKVLTGVSDLYREASGGSRQNGESDSAFADRQAKGITAVDKELGKYTKGVSDSEIDTAAKERLAEADKQVETAMNQLRDAVGTQLLPELIKMVPVLRDLTPVFANVLKEVAKFAEWFAANPIKGIGAVVLASVAKDIAGAAIGNAIKAKLVELLSGGGGAGSGASAGGGIAGSAAIKGLALGAATAGVIAKSGVAMYEGTDRAEDLAAKVDAWKRGDHVNGVSPEAAKKEVDESRKRLANQSVLATAADLALSPFLDSSDASYKRTKKDQGIVEGADKGNLKKALDGASIVDKDSIKAALTLAINEGVNAGMGGNGTAGSSDSPTRTLPLSARP